jgi:hypothetical protein
MTDDTQNPPETTLTVPKKRRKLSLTKTDRQELIERRQIELAVSLFLDLDQNRTVKQIAEEVGLPLSTLKRLTQNPLFQQVYDEQLMQLGHHPRLQAMNAQLPDLLPKSYQAMERLLSPGTAHTAQVAAVKLLWETTQIGEILAQEDPAAISNFLASKGVVVQNNTLVINALPAEYHQAFQKWMGGDVVEGQLKDTGTTASASDNADSGSGSPPLLSPTSETPASSPPEQSE